MLAAEKGKHRAQAHRDQRQPDDAMEKSVLAAGCYHLFILILRSRAYFIAPHETRFRHIGSGKTGELHRNVGTKPGSMHCSKHGTTLSRAAEPVNITLPIQSLLYGVPDTQGFKHACFTAF